MGATGLVGWQQTFLFGFPRPYAVMPITVVVPWFIISDAIGRQRWLSVLPLCVAVMPIAGTVVSRRLQIRWWAAGPVILFMALAWVWLGLGKDYGIQYHSLGYVVACSAAQTVIQILLVVIWFRNRKRPRLVTAAAFATIASIWLASYAFPYLGELP